MPITNLQKLGIDTSLEHKMTLTVSTDLRKNYQGVFRLLRRLTKNHIFSKEELTSLFAYLNSWRPNFNFTDEYETLKQQDRPTAHLLANFNKDEPNTQMFINNDTLILVYEGSPFRGSNIYVGAFRRPVDLPSGARVRNVLLISKAAVILLNWARSSYPDLEEEPTWKMVYKDQSDNSYFAVIAHYITSKFDRTNAHFHKKPLMDMFFAFYRDYLSSYSNIVQARDDEALRQGSVATAYETKKNIPDYIQERMENTSILSRFGFVEIDESVDLDDYSYFEAYVHQLEEAFPEFFDFTVDALRLRKLGKHSSANGTTLGLYYPHIDNIAIDIRDTSSFLHEWGHAFDKHHDDLSTKSEFLDTIYSKVVTCLAFADTLSDESRAYYSMPKEVFARAFEWYMFKQDKIELNGVMKTNEDYTTQIQYVCFEGAAEEVLGYFEKYKHLA